MLATMTDMVERPVMPGGSSQSTKGNRMIGPPDCGEREKERELIITDRRYTLLYTFLTPHAARRWVRRRFRRPRKRCTNCEDIGYASNERAGHREREREIAEADNPRNRR